MYNIERRKTKLDRCLRETHTHSESQRENMYNILREKTKMDRSERERER